MNLLRAFDLRVDTRRAWRSLVRHPIASASVVAVMATCAAATTLGIAAMRAASHPVLPYPEAEQLVDVLWTPAGERCGLGNVVNQRVPGAMAAQFLENGSASVGMFAIAGTPLTGMTAGANPVSDLLIQPVSSRYFQVLGVAPMLGYVPQALPNGAETRPSAILSFGSWSRRFNADSAVLGRVVEAGGQAYTITAVMPSHFELSGAMDAWIVGGQSASWSSHAADAEAWVIGRLKAGITPAGADEAVEVQSSRIRSSLPPDARRGSACVVAMQQYARPGGIVRLLKVAQVVLGILVATCLLSFVLLFLARELGRAPQRTVQAMLGATRWRMVRPTLVEAGIVGCLGALVGIVLAIWFFAVIRASPQFADQWWAPMSLPRLAVGSGVGLAVGMGLVPAALGVVFAQRVLRRMERRDVSSRPSDGEAISGRIIAVQVAVSILLLSLAVGGVADIMNFNEARGFDSARTAMVRVPQASDSLASVVTWSLRVDSLSRRFLQIPGVDRVGATQLQSRDARIGPARSSVVASPTAVRAAYVDSEFLKTLGLSLLKGRWIASQEYASEARVAVVSERAAIAIFGGDQILGKSVTVVEGKDRVLLQVVGVVSDVSLVPLNNQAMTPLVYSPALLNPLGGADIFAHGTIPGEQLAARISSALRRSTHGQAVVTVDPADAAWNAMQHIAALPVRIVASIAVLVLIAALIGVFGLALRIANARRRDIGIRSALGATASQNAWYLSRRVLGSAMVGGIIGGAIATMWSQPLLGILHVRAMALWLPTAVFVALMLAVAGACLLAVRSAVVEPPIQLIAGE